MHHLVIFDWGNNMHISPDFRGEPLGQLKNQELRDLVMFNLVKIDVNGPAIANVICKCCKHINEFGVILTSAF